MNNFRISFLLNILRIKRWILITFCICIDIEDIYIVAWDCWASIFNLIQSYGPWMTSEFCFCSISWGWINGFSSNFAGALILTASSLGWLSVRFYQFVTELWPLNAVRILFPFNILSMNEWILTIFCSWDCFESILVSLFWLSILNMIKWFLAKFCVNFQKFITELWPLIDVRILFLLNNLEANWWNLTKFVLGRSRMGSLHVYFCKFVTELWPVINVWICFGSIFWKLLDWFDQVLHIHW